jgi:glutaredoxin-like protein
MSASGITLYGTNWCSDCKRAKQFFGEQRVHYDFVDIEDDAEAMAYVEEVNDGKQVIPVIRFEDGSLLVEPSNADLAEKLGLQTVAKRHYYDLVVVGSGPAGLTAALYAAREGLDTLVVERAGVGGQAGVTELLDNFPGFPEGVSGAEFADRLRMASSCVRGAGDPRRPVRTVAVCGGSGAELATAAARSGADVLLTADLRHHPASEHVEDGGVALVDAAHWATEWPWLPQAAALLTTVETTVSQTVTDPWTVHAHHPEGP